MAETIKRMYEVDPLVCPSCGGEMGVVAFIVDLQVVDQILRHLRRIQPERGRGPPRCGQAEVNGRGRRQGCVRPDFSYTFEIEFEIGIPLRGVLLIQRGGMSTVQIIVAGTRHRALVCGVDRDVGSIEKGRIADLIMVAGDPLQDLSVLKHQLVVVVHSGVIIRDGRPSTSPLRPSSGRRGSPGDP